MKDKCREKDKEDAVRHAAHMVAGTDYFWVVGWIRKSAVRRLPEGGRQVACKIQVSTEGFCKGSVN